MLEYKNNSTWQTNDEDYLKLMQNAQQMMRTTKNNGSDKQMMKSTKHNEKR